jgi:outer membrane receptor protein involved in Fe transport
MKITFLLAIMFFCTQSYAQTIHGEITDKNNNRPLQFATIVIKRDTSIYKTGITDSLGNYAFRELGTSKYNMEVSSANYQKTSMSVFLKHDTIINLSLVPLPGQLKEVKIIGGKPLIERKSDRLVFNVANNVNAVGLDALELLAEAPQIRVYNDMISMIGKGSVRVMVNDRLLQMSPEALAAYLKALPGESIERIEVISNPPAMYSSEGGSGLINIILKRNREPGYSGTANLNLTSPSSQTAASGISMNYNKNNVRYYGSVNGADGVHNPTYTSTIFYPQLTQASATQEKEQSQYAGGQVGFDADLSKTNTLGASLNLFYSYPYQTNTVLTSFINNQTKNADSITEQNNKNGISYYSKSSNIHYVMYLDTLEKKRVVVDGDWYSDGFDFPNKISSTTYDGGGAPIPNSATKTNSNNTLSSTIYSLNGVVFLPVKHDELSIGGKINFIRNTNYVNLTINNMDQNTQEINTSNSFLFKENTQAAFVNYNGSFGKKWRFESGLRAENTQTKGVAYDSTNKNSYFELFPSAYLTYALNDKNTMSVDYGRRINRPGFNSFNPYPQYTSQYTYFEGNPYLLPSISNNFELADSYGNFDISAQYSFSNEGVGNIGIVDTNSNITVTKPFNFLSTRSFVVSAYYTFEKIKWWESSNELDVYHEKTISSSNLTDPTISGWAANIRSNNSFFFNKAKTIVGGLYFFYQFPEVSGINKFGSYYHFDISGKYLLLKSKLQLAIKLTDVFKTLNIPFKSTVNDIVTSNVINNDSRRLTLSIRYNFGNAKLKKGEAHSADSNNNRAF